MGKKNGSHATIVGQDHATRGSEGRRRDCAKRNRAISATRALVRAAAAHFSRDSPDDDTDIDETDNPSRQLPKAWVAAAITASSAGVSAADPTWTVVPGRQGSYRPATDRLQ